MDDLILSAFKENKPVFENEIENFVSKNNKDSFPDFKVMLLIYIFFK